MRVYFEREKKKSYSSEKKKKEKRKKKKEKEKFSPNTRSEGDPRISFADNVTWSRLARNETKFIGLDSSGKFHANSSICLFSSKIQLCGSKENLFVFLKKKKEKKKKKKKETC